MRLDRVKPSGNIDRMFGGAAGPVLVIFLSSLWNSAYVGKSHENRWDIPLVSSAGSGPFFTFTKCMLSGRR